MNTQPDTITLDDVTLTVRPIAITDAERLARLFDRLSPTTVHYRFFSPVRRPPRAALLRLADVDHNKRDALVALEGDEIVGVARYDAVSGTNHAEIALTVEDSWQHHGLGQILGKRLGRLAFARGYDAFVATMLPDNQAAIGLMRKLSPHAHVEFGGGEYEASMPLRSAS